MAEQGRVFVRGLTSQTYGLGEFRRQQLKADRVRDDSRVVDDAKVAHSGDSADSRTWWRIGPGDQDSVGSIVADLLTRSCRAASASSPAQTRRSHRTAPSPGPALGPWRSRLPGSS